MRHQTPNWSTLLPLPLPLLIFALSLLSPHPAHAGQAYNYKYYGDDVLQLTAELLDGNRTVLYNSSVLLESLHHFQITAFNETGYRSASGDMRLTYGSADTIVDYGTWSIESFGPTSYDYGELAGTITAQSGGVDTKAWTTGLASGSFDSLIVVDTHTITGNL